MKWLLQSVSCLTNAAYLVKLKAVVNLINAFTVEVFNRSLSTGHVPDNFKTAYIMPRVKKSNSDPADPSLYTPISNLSVLPKFLEQLTARRLLEHLVGVSSHLLSRLQSVMNTAARLIFSSSKFQHIIPLLCQLCWLKAPERIAFNYAVLIYKCLYGSAPAYLTDELCQVADVDARQRLRSSSSCSLLVNCTWLSTAGDRAIPVAAARVWNSLLDLVTSHLL